MTSLSSIDPYEVLGVSRAADDDEIKKGNYKCEKEHGTSNSERVKDD
jgi:DnaJ-class molecular chaperone